MKKTYQNPMTNIVTLSVARMIAGSGGLLGDGEKPKTLHLDDAEETTATSGNLSRRRSEWDDEEEEDF